jgi:hypothetical protein
LRHLTIVQFDQCTIALGALAQLSHLPSLVTVLIDCCVVEPRQRPDLLLPDIQALMVHCVQPDLFVQLWDNVSTETADARQAARQVRAAVSAVRPAARLQYVSTSPRLYLQTVVV